mmetsp:Transcript_11039/g.15231  ORF Transcript_11039/g.15231 Transcript_11039/m.15231 type:complete len:206 (+) Transcript_11039:43-660(+)
MIPCLSLNIERSIFLLCDVQTRFRPLIFRSETVIRKSALLYNVCSILQVPCIVTEQKPKALGSTVQDIKLFQSDGTPNPGTKIFEKLQFSMFTNEVKQELEILQRDQIILCGIEAHVCVQQTVMDLRARGFDIFIACDATSSQRPYDRSVAINRMLQMGVKMCSVESIIFDLMKTAEHPKFKEVSALVVSHNKDFENEFANDHFI